ncbi:hypothetical protein [Streptosporangium roseum]
MLIDAIRNRVRAVTALPSPSRPRTIVSTDDPSITAAATPGVP